LQIVVTLLALIPITVGAAGMLVGPASVGASDPPRDLDSHFRYLSGIFMALGFVFWSCVPNIEQKGALFRVASALVVAGGLGRLLAYATQGPPSGLHVAGLVMELIVVPGLAVWQARVAI
jgi:hypothetical protein